MTSARWSAVILLLASFHSVAWDTLPHQRITRSALDVLPKPTLDQFGGEARPLTEIYCIYPDRYLEMEQFGFIRRSPGPKSASEIRVYCAGTDGQPIHGITGDLIADNGSIAYVLEGIASSLSGRRPGEAARYSGVLSHFIADSLSPPHSISADELQNLRARWPATESLNLHSILERSIPEFHLSQRQPSRLGYDLAATAQAIVDRCYEGAALNRRDLPAMIRAVLDRDGRTLDRYRLRAGRMAAEIVADALYTALRTRNRGRAGRR